MIRKTYKTIGDIYSFFVALRKIEEVYVILYVIKRCDYSKSIENPHQRIENLKS